jgi:hypothetical protein
MYSDFSVYLMCVECVTGIVKEKLTINKYESMSMSELLIITSLVEFYWSRLLKRERQSSRAHEVYKVVQNLFDIGKLKYLFMYVCRC